MQKVCHSPRAEGEAKNLKKCDIGVGRVSHIPLTFSRSIKAILNIGYHPMDINKECFYNKFSFSEVVTFW